MQASTTYNDDDQNMTLDDLITFIDTNANQIKNIRQIKKNAIIEKEDISDLDVGHEQKVTLKHYAILKEYNLVRCGTISYISGFDVELSLIHAIVIGLKSGFEEMQISYQEQYLHHIYKMIVSDIETKRFELVSLTGDGWSKTKMNEEFKNNFLTPAICQYIAEHFCINIFVFDINEPKITFFGRLPCKFTKKNICVTFNSETKHYELLLIDKKGFFTFDHGLASLLVSENVEVINFTIKKSTKIINSVKIFEVCSGDENDQYLTNYVDKLSEIYKKSIPENNTITKPLEISVKQAIESDYSDSDNGFEEEIISNCSEEESSVTSDVIKSSKQVKPKVQNKIEKNIDLSPESNNTNLNFSKMLLSDVKKLASEHKIALTKSGKAKKKQDLIDEIKKKLNNI